MEACRKKYYSLLQWFPTFSVSWTLLTFWLKAVDPLIKPNQTLLRNMSFNHPKAVYNIILEIFRTNV